MKEIHHKRGVVSRSLKPRDINYPYIAHRENGFTARYQGKDGKHYEISFNTYQRQGHLDE